MHFDAGTFLRLDAPQSLGASASGASFATSTGDILEVDVLRTRRVPAARGPEHAARLRPRAARASLHGRARAGRTLDVHRRRHDARARRAPLRFRCCTAAHPVLASITDEHFRGWTRLPAFGRVRHGGQWIAAFALASGEPVYGLGEKFGPLDKRGQLIHSQVDDALGVNTGSSYKNAPFAWSPGTGRGAWGVFVNTPGDGDARRRAPGLVAPHVRAARRRRGARPVPVRRRHAGRDPRALHAAHRPCAGRCRAGASGLWVSRAYYKTPEEAADVAAKLRERRIPCDVLTLDGRAAWKVETRFDFEWDPERFPDPRAALARSRRTTCASASGSIRTCRSIAAVRRARRARLPAERRRRRAATCSAGTRTPGRARSATC